MLALNYARIVGVVLTLIGIMGLLVTTSQSDAGNLLGFDVNLLHNLVHLVSGVLGLLVGFSLVRYARTYALVFGVVYLLVALLGFMNAGLLADLFVSVNTADDILHLALGVLGIAAGLMSDRTDDDIAVEA